MIAVQQFLIVEPYRTALFARRAFLTRACIKLARKTDCIKRKRNRMKNRIEQKWLEVLKQFADGYWTNEIEQAHDLFDTPYPPKDDKDYIKKTTFLDNAKRSKLQMLKYLAQSKSGALHPTGENSTEEKREADKLLKLAEQRISQN